MPDRPEELRILVHEDMRADLQRRITRRQAMMAAGSGALALWLAGCGGSSGTNNAERTASPGAAETPSVATDAPIEDRLLIANWVDYTDPANYKDYTKEFGPKISVSGYGSNDELLAKLRAGGSKFDIVAPTGYAVKTMIEQGLALKLNQELIPNLANLQPTFRQVEYDPGNEYSVPKDYGITSFFWLTDKVDAQPKTIRECFDLLKTPEFKDLRVNFLEGGTQLVGMALKALGYSLNSEDEGELEEAKQLLLDVKPNVDTINSTFIERASRGDIDFGMGWNGDVRRAIQTLAKKDREMVFLVPEDSTEYWVDNWVIPAGAEHPVAAHKWLNFILEPENAGREMDYHQYSVPVEGITEFIAKDLAEDPLIVLPDETIARYETQLQTPEGLQKRERIYTEFKAA